MKVKKITEDELYQDVKNVLDKYGISMIEFVNSDRYRWYEDPTWELTDLHLMCADKIKKYMEKNND